MRTLSFIGSDKNAGKTTVLNWFYNRLTNTFKPSSICLTSVGINGEDIDNYENFAKPHIKIKEGSFFVTHERRLLHLKDSFQEINIFSPPNFSNNYILGKALKSFEVVMEGPNDKTETLKIKKEIVKIIPEGLLIIDGSIDRQFLGDPLVSDEFYFSLLLSNRKEQIDKARDLLTPLNFKLCTPEDKKFIDLNSKQYKSMIWSSDSILYRAEITPFMDDSLKKILTKNKKEKLKLYIKGALSRSLYDFLSTFDNLEIILNNFTLYLNVSTNVTHYNLFKPNITLLHSANVKKIFWREEEDTQVKISELPIPKEISVHNIFKENANTIII